MKAGLISSSWENELLTFAVTWEREMVGGVFIYSYIEYN
jgi:hypothetical protein